MAKHRRRGSSNVSFSDNSPEFFKIYFPDRSSHHMQIPPAFVKNFDGKISPKAILKDTVGKSWHVDLKEANKGVFMKNGWQAFVSDNSLELGDFLVFRYNNDSSFTVKVFGKSGCKRDRQDSTMRVKLEEEEEEESHERVPYRKRKYSKQGVWRPKRSKGCGEEKKLKSPRTTSNIVDKKRITEDPGFVAPQRPYFCAVLTKSLPRVMEVPFKVLRENKIKLEREMVLRNQSGKKWPVRVCWRKSGRSFLSKGWTIFCLNNNLSIGDKCVLEFLKGRGGLTKTILVSSMFRTKEGNN